MRPRPDGMFCFWLLTWSSGTRPQVFASAGEGFPEQIVSPRHYWEKPPVSWRAAGKTVGPARVGSVAGLAALAALLLSWAITMEGVETALSVS